MLGLIENKYGFLTSDCTLTPFGNGLINQTWLLMHKGDSYIFQRINDNVFHNPSDIAENIHALKEFFNTNFSDYLFVKTIQTLDKKEIVFHPSEGYCRMFEFVIGSKTFNTLQNSQLAFEGAKQFGRFTKNLSKFDVSKLHITLVDFHNLSLRYQQFETALNKGNTKRIKACAKAIEFIESQKSIVDEFDKIKTNSNFKKRVTHHDTKISNVLFDANDKGLCVIDLDTVMPGYFISDVGDMLRTYLSPVSEEEADYSKIEIREDYFQAILEGYISEMKDELSDEEKSYFVYAGKFMIYMQALRFITDYFNNDSYYGSKYEGQNLVRANNQLVLLKILLSKEQALELRVTQYLENSGV
jgi:Ser/Thr protein kinase RdoA (MazF antagonist)